MFKRIACLIFGHIERQSYKVGHPDILSVRCARCEHRWLKAKASGL